VKPDAPERTIVVLGGMTMDDIALSAMPGTGPAP